MATATESLTLTQVCTFWADGLYFGISVTDVQEVLRAQAMTAVPLASGWVRGLLNLRGEIVTAIDLRHRLELRPWDGHQERMNVVVRSRGEVVSLLVDDIGDVIDTADLLLEPAPSTVPRAVQEVLQGVIPLPDKLLLVLDANRTGDMASPNPLEGK